MTSVGMFCAKMSLTMLFASFLTVQAESARVQLAPRGYELLPNARWQEELARDSRGSLFLPSSQTTATDAATLDLEFDYVAALHSWDGEALAGGFRFELDPTSYFIFRQSHTRAHKVWQILGWFVPGRRKTSQ